MFVRTNVNSQEDETDRMLRKEKEIKNKKISTYNSPVDEIEELQISSVPEMSSYLHLDKVQSHEGGKTVIQTVVKLTSDKEGVKTLIT